MRSETVMRAGMLAGAFVLMFGLTASTQAPSGQAGPSSGQTDEHPKLPPGEGRDVMIRVCGQCHSPDSAADQDLDAKGWKGLVDDMAAKGADATDEQLQQIVAYLSKAFPPSK
jgi:competence protein ComEA